MNDETINFANVGAPVPMGYRVEQIEGNMAGQRTMMVKLYIASPTGLATYFLDGEEAEALARDLRNAGRHAKMGIWSPQGGAPEPTGPTPRAFGGEQGSDPSSPSRRQSGR